MGEMADSKAKIGKAQEVPGASHATKGERKTCQKVAEGSLKISTYENNLNIKIMIINRLQPIR